MPREREKREEGEGDGNNPHAVSDPLLLLSELSNQWSEREREREGIHATILGQSGARTLSRDRRYTVLVSLN